MSQGFIVINTADFLQFSWQVFVGTFSKYTNSIRHNTLHVLGHVSCRKHCDPLLQDLAQWITYVDQVHIFSVFSRKQDIAYNMKMNITRALVSEIFEQIIKSQQVRALNWQVHLHRPMTMLMQINKKFCNLQLKYHNFHDNKTYVSCSKLYYSIIALCWHDLLPIVLIRSFTACSWTFSCRTMDREPH